MIVPPAVSRLIPLVAAAALLLAPAAGAQEDDPVVVARAVVPVMGHIVGFEGVLWRSDLVLYNDSAQPADILISPLPAPDLFQFRTLEPGESLVFPNVAADSFGIASGVTPLLVQTLGPRSVTVFATAYGLHEGRLTPTVIVPVLYGPLPAGVQHLRGLAMNADRRTDLGIVNLAGAPASFTISLQRLEQRPIAVQTVTLGPESSVHVPLNQLFPLVAEGDGLTVVVDGTSPESWAYACVVRNDTHEVTFVMPVFRGR